MRMISARRLFGRGPGFSSPGHKKRYIVGRPVRSGWRPATLRYSSLAFAPALLISGAVVAMIGISSSSRVAETASVGTAYTISGQGDGHGRGMGQWGAFGYAKAGWSAERILGYYYGGTTIGMLPPTKIKVRLQARDNKPLDVISDAGMTVAGRHVNPGQAAHLVPTAGGGANASITDGCTGPVVWQGPTDNPWIDPVNPGVDRPVSENLKLCDGGLTYRGSLGVALDGTSNRTVDYVDMEDYLRSVVPLEMQPNWADQNGAEALRAQAIAARSYAATDNRYSYAQTCDTQDCQMYGGSSKEDPRTTDAVQSTQGKVLMQDGKVVHAEYSASTGGATAGGAFPVVKDAGDAVTPAAEEHWSRTESAGDIGKAFGVGNLQAVNVSARTAEGRVATLHVVGSTKTVDVTGDEARQKLGLPSDWFDISQGAGAPAVPAPMAPMPPVPPAAVPPAAAPPGATAAPPPAALPGSSPIEDKYRQMGGLAGTLGPPLGPVMDLPEGAGKFRTFANGVIVWTPVLGAQSVDASELSGLAGVAASAVH